MHYQINLKNQVIRYAVLVCYALIFVSKCVKYQQIRMFLTHYDLSLQRCQDETLIITNDSNLQTSPASRSWQLFSFISLRINLSKC